MRKKPAEKWQEARARREVAMANKAEVEFAEKMGQVVSSAQVERDAFMIARTVRDKLQNIPAQICHSLAGMNDPEIIRQSLEEKIGEVLQELVHGMKKENSSHAQ